MTVEADQEARPLRILLIDDNPADRLLSSRILSREFADAAVTPIEDLSSFRAALDKGAFDVVVSDWQLEWSTGLDVLTAVKRRFPDRPVIMFTATGTQDGAIEAMKAGLDDYVIKSAAAFARLPATIRSALVRLAVNRRTERAQRRVSRLLEDFDIGVFRMTPAGELLESNGALFSLLELSPDDISSLPTLRERLRLPPSAGGVPRNRREEIRFQKSDGSPAWLALSLRVERIAGDTVIEGLVEDITPRKDLEIERARRLLSERAARAEAEAANRAKDDFLAVLSHELRTPLNAMVGWLRLLRIGSLDRRKTRRALDTIERNAYTQARLIDELLDVSRIVTRKIELELKAVDLASVVRATMDTIGPPAQEKRLRLQADVDASIGPVLGDSVRLQQALGNVLSNALKFTPAGGALTVRLFRVDSHAEIAVTDTGRGIPPELLPHIFDRFRQGDMATTRAHGGLGLGLAIARHLVELHGGSIRAESPGDGGGSTITISLPIPAISPEPASVAPVQARGSAVGPAVIKLHGVHALVVDDDVDAGELLTVALDRWAVRVTVATSAGEALARFAADPPDVVISDIGMPGEDGYSLIRRLREKEAGRHTPAIALTALVGTDHRAQALAAGFDVHLPKPVHIPDLVQVIGDLVTPRG